MLDINNCLKSIEVIKTIYEKPFKAAIRANTWSNVSLLIKYSTNFRLAGGGVEFSSNGCNVTKLSPCTDWSRYILWVGYIMLLWYVPQCKVRRDKAYPDPTTHTYDKDKINMS